MDESFAEALESAEPIPDAVRPDHEGGGLPLLREHVEESAERSGSSGALGYALAAGILLAALGAGYIFAAPVVKLWPASLGIYETVGLSPPLPGQHLVVDRVTAEVVTGERGLNVLHVKGYAMNLKPEAQTVPPLRVSLLRKGGEAIDSWVIEAQRNTLAYEEEVSFTTTYPAPPADAHAVNVRLEPFAAMADAAVKEDDHKPRAPDAHHEAAKDEGHEKVPAKAADSHAPAPKEAAHGGH